MVFGWGKKSTKENTILPTASEKRISLSEINEILKEREAKRFKTLSEKSKSVRDRVEVERKDIIQIVSQLERDNLEADDVDKHLKVIIERGKKAVVSGLQKETTINLSRIEKYPDIINLNLEVGQLLKRIGDILGTQSRIMHVFARKYTDRLKEHISKIATCKTELQKIVDEHSRFESSVSNILVLSEKIKTTKNEIARKNDNLLEIKKEIEDHTKTIQTLERAVHDMKSKVEYQEFLKIKKEIESLETEKNKIRYEVDTQFSKISRPLGKYSYISSLEKPVKKIIEFLIENPTDAIVPDNKNSVIEILHAVVKGVVSGNVSVKDSQKATEQIEETINRLDEFLKMKEGYKEKISALETKLAIFDFKGLEEKERILQKTVDSRMLAESKVLALQKELDEDIKLIPQLVVDMEKKLNDVIGGKVILKIQD